MQDRAALEHEWMPRLLDLAGRIRAAARAPLVSAARAGSLRRLSAPHGQGAGDVTYGIDVPAEEALTRWLEEVARDRPLSLLSEDAGWRHRGPAAGGTTDLAGFAHGGPRLSVDPIDGTRNLMADLRGAWCVIGLAGPGEGAPRQRDVALGVVAEIPDSRAAFARELWAARGRGAHRRLTALAGGSPPGAERLVCDADDRADHGYFPFFRYMPDQRPAIARVEAEFFARLAREEGADVRNCYDDQHISNGGQLALLALGTYRMVCDLRAELARRAGVRTLTGKPYDVCGAILVAEEAGCVVTDARGGPLDFPLDVETPVGFVGWHNRATRARLERHLSAALG
jgi:fructose-1,6-bisphosphatase/inositol monophosphatase family enzyme